MKLKYSLALLLLFRIILSSPPTNAQNQDFFYAVYVDSSNEEYISLNNSIEHKAQTNAQFICNRKSFAKGCKLLKSGNNRFVVITKETYLNKFQYKGNVAVYGFDSSEEKALKRVKILCQKKCHPLKFYDQQSRREYFYFDNWDRIIYDPALVYY